MTNREYINSLSNNELANLFCLEFDDAPWDDYAFSNTKVFIGETPPWQTYRQAIAKWLELEYDGWNEKQPIKK